jgi:hypothetical protein
MTKFKYSSIYTKKNYKAEFIISCLQLPKSKHKDIMWAKEMKIMNQLSKKCDNPDFWFHARTTFPIPSLAWFLTSNGRKYLNEKFRAFNFSLKTDQKEKPKLSSQKIGEDLGELQKKPKTIMDFLKKRR